MSAFQPIKAGTRRAPAFAHGLAAGVAVVVAATVIAAPTAAVAAAPAVAAATDQDDDDDEPQAGTVIVSIVKPHDCHLALRHSMRRVPAREPGRGKIFDRTKIQRK